MRYTITIKENKDFVTLYKKGRFTSGKAVTVYYRKNPRGLTRLGITTGKKVGNAVTRSRCRRMIRAAFYRCEESFPKGYDYIIVARSACGEVKSTNIESFFIGKVIPDIKKNTQKNNTKSK